MSPITREMLRAYICDALPDAELAAVERSLRESSELRALLKEVIEQEDRGEHTPGAGSASGSVARAEINSVGICLRPEIPNYWNTSGFISMRSVARIAGQTSMTFE